MSNVYYYYYLREDKKRRYIYIGSPNIIQERLHLKENN